MTKLFVPMLGEAISRFASVDLSKDEAIVILSTLAIVASIFLLFVALLLRAKAIGNRWDDRTKYQS